LDSTTKKHYTFYGLACVSILRKGIRREVNDWQDIQGRGRATGGVGRYAIRTAADRPNLELVGAWGHSAAEDGQDVGILAGIKPSGVTASRDVDALLDGDADCIMYAAPAGPRSKEALADFCRILAAGKNIVTTSLPGLVYEKGSLSERYLEPIREACRAGNSAWPDVAELRHSRYARVQRCRWGWCSYFQDWGHAQRHLQSLLRRLRTGPQGWDTHRSAWQGLNRPPIRVTADRG
jgi:hypothetical protein